MPDDTTIIEARPKTILSQLRAGWQFRSFYTYLLWEITIRKFRDTMLGFWWLILRPLIPALVMIVLFTGVVRLDTGSVPYPIFLLSGMVVWNAFQATLVFMPRTLLWMRGMMRRIYFPRILIPAASVGPSGLEIAVNVSLLAVCIAYYFITTGSSHLVVSWAMLLYPVSIICALMIGMGLGMMLSVVAVLMRDIVFTVPYFVQIAMLFSPVVYPLSVIPEHVRWIVLLLNPMAVLIETARFSLTGVGYFNPAWFAVAVLWSVLILGLSIWFFLRAETHLSDHL